MLAICCQNVRRSQEIVKYSVDEYFKDLGLYEQQQQSGEEGGDNLTLHFMQHETQKKIGKLLSPLYRDS